MSRPPPWLHTSAHTVLATYGRRLPQECGNRLAGSADVMGFFTGCHRMAELVLIKPNIIEITAIFPNTSSKHTFEHTKRGGRRDEVPMNSTPRASSAAPGSNAASPSLGLVVTEDLPLALRQYGCAAGWWRGMDSISASTEAQRTRMPLCPRPNFRVSTFPSLIHSSSFFTENPPRLAVRVRLSQTGTTGCCSVFIASLQNHKGPRTARPPCTAP